MLYLAPPFHIIDGISIFRDHEDELQYYFMPLYPHLTTVKDAVTGADVPQIQLIKYRGEAGNGGFLNFDVNLGIMEDKLQELTASIKSLENLDQTPRLAPVPLVDGTVKLMILNKQSPEPANDTDPVPANDKPEGPQFVISMQHHAKPALYGTNQAAFSVQLDEAGVVVVEQAIQGEMAPIGVVYSLDYMCLRDGYKVSVNADWERVQKHFDESFSVNTPIFSSTVDTIVDELIETRVIDMQIDKLFVTDDTTSELEARMNEAVNQIKDMVLDNFFEPSLEPIENKEDNTIRDIGRVALILASGGASESTTFSYKKTDITRIDKKKLNVNFSERTAVIRSIYPQGHLGGLFTVLREPGIELSRFVMPVELDNPWFKKRKVNVIARTDFDSDNIESLNVTLTYNGASKNVLLDKNKTTEQVHWLSKIVDDKMVPEVSCSYIVNFKKGDGLERPSKVVSPPEIITVENYEVRPREIYGNTPIAILALNFPWDVYSHVEIAIKYTDEENEIRTDDNILLNKDKTEATWQLFSLNPTKNVFSYQLIYRGVDHRDLIMPWQESEAENIIIRDPFPDKRRISFVPAVSWAEVKNIFADVVYTDKENGVRESNSVSFSETDNNPKDVIIQQFKNPEARIVSFKITFIYADGRVIETPTCQTLSDRIFITTAIKGHKILLIDPSGIAFKDNKIKEAKLQIRYEDEEAKLSFNDNFSFKSENDQPRYFEYDFVDPDNAAVLYRLELHYENGMKKTGNWLNSKDDLLKLTV
ncbi:MAG: hypothetical protein PHV53_02685 [Fermentimonas sp.]|nr:hypothetical protein [Fermentimonas sp.]